MILEEDSLLQLSYDTTTQVLSVIWPELSFTSVAEIEKSLQKLSRNIKNFDIRKMLVDLQSGFEGVDKEAYKKAVGNYHRSLAETPLKKVARLIPEKPAWEYFVEQYSHELVKKYNLPFEVRFFTKKDEALAWLLE